MAVDTLCALKYPLPGVESCSISDPASAKLCMHSPQGDSRPSSSSLAQDSPVLGRRHNAEITSSPDGETEPRPNFGDDRNVHQRVDGELLFFVATHTPRRCASGDRVVQFSLCLGVISRRGREVPGQTHLKMRSHMSSTE